MHNEEIYDFFNPRRPAWNGFIWLRRGASGRLVRTGPQTFGLHKPRDCSLWRYSKSVHIALLQVDSLQVGVHNV